MAAVMINPRSHCAPPRYVNIQSARCHPLELLRGMSEQAYSNSLPHWLSAGGQTLLHSRSMAAFRGLTANELSKTMVADDWPGVTRSGSKADKEMPSASCQFTLCG